MKEKGETRILLLTDIHAPYHDERALDKAVEFGLTKDIDEVIISELPDLYKVSSWMRDPDTLPFFKELEEVAKVTESLAKSFKRQAVTYLVGNHEERITNYLRRNAPELCGIKSMSIDSLLGISAAGWEYVDNRRRLMEGKQALSRGKLTILHGHEVKMGWGCINLAKILYERTRCNVIAGHHHRVQEWTVRLITGEHEGAWMVGCLCDLRPEYLPVNDWLHGFAIIHMYKDGTFSIENRKIMGNKVL